MKNFIIKILHSRAKAMLDKFNPKIVAITGSIGKTSATNAIEIVLKDHFKVRAPEKNYNNEIGVPLTILGLKSPGRSVFGWLKLFFKTLSVKSCPDILILEFGVDHPGDMKTLCELAQPSVAVITGISPIHAEFFKDIDDLAREKGSLMSCLPENGLAVLNVDDERVLGLKHLAAHRVLTYGVKAGQVSAANIQIQTREDKSFEPGEAFVKTTADVLRDGQTVARLELTNLIGYAPVMACLAAIAVGEHFGVSVTDAVEILNREMAPEPGRLNPVAGIKGSLIIDDSYNAAPAAMRNGLEVLKLFEPGEEFDRRIAVLGQMMELGQYSDDEHRLIGIRVAEVADLFIAVGENMRTAVAAAKEAGMNVEAVEWFGTSTEAGRYLDKVIKPGDVIYVKGSQSSRMEKVVKDLMAEPLRAPQLLVRQDEKWLAK